MLGVCKGTETVGYVTARIPGVWRRDGLESLKKFRSLRIGKTHETSMPLFCLVLKVEYY